MNILVELEMKPKGIILWGHDVTSGKGASPLLEIGDRWIIGATDREAFPYEVSIIVVKRRNDEA